MKIMENKKILLLATVFAIGLPAAASVAATTANIDATAQFTSALAIVNTQNMDFGNWLYGGSPAGGDEIALGTDDVPVPTINFQADTPAGTPAAGIATVTGVGTFGIEITCDSTAVLTDGAGASIGLKDVEVTDGAGGAPGTGDLCSGSPVLYNLVAGSSVIRVGATVDGGTAVAFVNGTYSTASAGGDDIQIDVAYQ